MARCLRCKAGNEWIEGDVKPDHLERETDSLRSQVEALTRERDEALRAERYAIDVLASEQVKRQAAESRAEALRKDAERYRWLRDDQRGRALSMSALEWTGNATKADAAIDAAIHSASGQSVS